MKKFLEPEMEIVVLATEDVLTTSSEGGIELPVV